MSSRRTLFDVHPHGHGVDHAVSDCPGQSPEFREKYVFTTIDGVHRLGYYR
jgi:hypothetical protein